MARSIRIQAAGAYYHIMARGNRREDIFHDDDDRRFFLHTLGQACEMTGWRVHACVLMSKHYHLFIQTPEPNLGSSVCPFVATVMVRARYDYDLWGARTKITGDLDAMRGYTGHPQHASGLILAPFRAYDAELGRWLNEDPLEEDGGLNLYGYVGNGPLSRVDPLGLIDWGPGTEPWKAGAESNPVGQAAIDKIKALEKKTGKTCSVRMGKPKSGSETSPKGDISLDPHDASNGYYYHSGGIAQFTQGQILVHELGHVNQYWTGNGATPSTAAKCEMDAINNWENPFLDADGKRPARINHNKILRP